MCYAWLERATNDWMGSTAALSSFHTTQNSSSFGLSISYRSGTENIANYKFGCILLDYIDRIDKTTHSSNILTLFQLDQQIMHQSQIAINSQRKKVSKTNQIKKVQQSSKIAPMFDANIFDCNKFSMFDLFYLSLNKHSARNVILLHRLSHSVHWTHKWIKMFHDHCCVLLQSVDSLFSLNVL